MRKLTLILFAGLVGMMSGKSQNLYLDGIYYNFIQTSDDQVEVTFPTDYRHDDWTGEGDYYGHIRIPETISYEGKTYRVTAIGQQAFREAPVEAVTIPKTIEVMEWDAFRDSWCLKKIEVRWETPLDLREIEEKYFPKHSDPDYSRTAEEIFSFTERELEQIVLVVPKGSKELYEHADIWNRFIHIKEKKEYPEQTLSILGGKVTLQYSQNGFAQSITIRHYDKQGQELNYDVFAFEPKELDSEEEAMRKYFEEIIKLFFENEGEGMGQKVYDAFIEEGGVQAFFDIIEDFQESENII